MKDRGHTVYDCTSEGNTASENLYQIVHKCNAHDVDIDVSIHLNCSNGQGHGTETLIYSSKSKAKKQAKKITKNIAELGYTNRGVKVRSDLYVLHRTNAPALLVETFFCDNKTDCATYKKVGYKGIAKAIADGITTKTLKQKIVDKIVKKKNSTKKSNTEIAKEVIAGKWGNGETRKERLQESGYDYKTIQNLVNQLLKK